MPMGWSPVVLLAMVLQPLSINKAEKRNRLDRTMVRVLPELERLERKHLLDFLRSHEVPLPNERLEPVVDRILADTEGAYMETLEHLKDLASRVWRDEDRRRGGPTSRDEDPGY